MPFLTAEASSQLVSELTTDHIDFFARSFHLRIKTLDDKLKALPASSDEVSTISRSQADLGVFSLLSAELLSLILDQLDPVSFGSFRLTNRASAELTHAHIKHKTLVKHIPNLIRGFHALRIANPPSCSDFFESLILPQCVHCKEFGAFLHLLTAQRICYQCLARDESYALIRSRDAITHFGLSPQAIRSLPRITPSPQLHDQLLGKRSRFLPAGEWLNFETAYNAGLTLHGSPQSMSEHILTNPLITPDPSTENLLWLDQSPFPIHQRVQLHLRAWPSRNPIPPSHGNRMRLRFYAVIRAPMPVPPTMRGPVTFEPVFYCKACMFCDRRNHAATPCPFCPDRRRHFGRLYTLPQLREHVVDACVGEHAPHHSRFVNNRVVRDVAFAGGRWFWGPVESSIFYLV